MEGQGSRDLDITSFPKYSDISKTKVFWESKYLLTSLYTHNTYIPKYLVNHALTSTVIWSSHWGLFIPQRHKSVSNLVKVMTCRHVITWTNVDLSSCVFCGIQLKSISQEVSKNSICNMCSGITRLLLTLQHITSANELLNMKLGHIFVITSYCFTWKWLLIHILNTTTE